MINNELVMIGMLFTCLFYYGVSDTIFGNPTVFHSQYCNIGFQNAGTRNFPCVTPTPQSNIVNTAAAFTEFSKPQIAVFRLGLSVIYASDPTTTFNIKVQYSNPVAGMYIGVFLVVIKQQTTNLYIDLVNFKWGSGTPLDNLSSTVQTDTQSVDLTSTSIFTTVPAGLKTIPFVSSWRILTPVNSSQGFHDAYIPIEFQLTPQIIGNTLSLSLIVSSFNKMQQFRAFVIIFNPSQASLAKTNGLSMGYLIHTYKIGSTLDLILPAKDYGPGFDSKCILGFYRFKFWGINTFQYGFTNTFLGNYSVYKQVRGANSSQDGTFFCFGNDTACGEGYTHLDSISLQCYLANTCPLPVFTGWTSTDKCPSCIQLICETCDVLTRKSCTKCLVDSNSHLQGTKCVCNTNYIEVLTSIDTSSLGLWDHNAQSLSKCRLNCSAVIEGCNTYDCTDAKYCTSCQTNYVIVVVSLTNQICKFCSVQIPNCITCTNQNICSQCGSTSYMSVAALLGFVLSSSCPLCSSVMPHCISCSNDQTCLTCEAGYIVNGMTKKCDCDKTYQNLQNCDYCLIPSQCQQCLDLFYINSTTFRCQPCSDIHNECQNCSDQSTCTQCQTGFTLDSTRIPGIVTCTECRVVISNCTECSSTTTCTNCDDFYGLDSLGCTLCEPLVMPGCLLCEESTSCLTCMSSARMINNVCRFCNETFNCIDCFVTSFLTLECLQCSDGFYLSNDMVTATVTCKTCQNVCNYCKNCLSENQCISCLEPYLIGSTGICDQCISGYQYMGGFCMKQAGCISLYITPQGEEICLSCAIDLHFVMNTTSMKCVCNVGYQSYTPPGSLMTCLPICGDGIPLSGYEECDDNNTENQDGCDINCKVQEGFECSVQRPSKCVLLLEIKSFEFNHALRIIPQNKAILSFTIYPAVKAFKKLDWKKMLTLEFFSSTAVTVQTLKFQYSQQTNEILITVPYNQQLQETILQTKLELDPSVIKSQGKQVFFMANQLKGKNAPLLFESAGTLSTYQNINTISMIIIVILLVQFYLGSYTHKMIGLETIQIIQTIYFVRMITSSTSSSLLQSMNSIQFSATGYQNAELIFGHTYDAVKSERYKSISTQFMAINMEKYFLINVNITLVPLVFVIALFFVKLKQKITKRKQFLETKEQQAKDSFIRKRRSYEWVYEHLVFPFVMMFNMVCFFFSVLCFTSNTSGQSSKTKLIEILSFPTHVLMVLGTIGIYCNEIFKSVDGYLFHRMSEKQRQRRHLSMIEKLQQDISNPDRANYHPLYVLVHCLYYLILEIMLVFGVLFKEFNSKLELTLVITFIYFLLIIIWKPYHQSINIHNKFLVFNHASLLFFLIICEVFAKVNKLSSTFYIVSMYLTMVLLSLIMIGGFVRIFFQNNFRKSLERNSSLLQQIIESENNEIQGSQKDNKNDAVQVLPKNFGLIANNPYAFKNQLKFISKTYGIGKDNQQLGKKPFQKNLSLQEQIYIIEKLRQQFKKKRQQNFVNDILQNEKNLQKKTNITPKKIHNDTFFEANSFLNDFNLNDQVENHQFIDTPQLQTKKNDASTESQQMTRLKEIKAKLKSQLNYMFN